MTWVDGYLATGTFGKFLDDFWDDFWTIFGTISCNFFVLWMVPELVGQFKKFKVDQFCQVEVK